LLLLLPYKVDVDSSRKPFANYLVMVAIVAVFALKLARPNVQMERFELDGWSAEGLLGYMWLHIGFLHIIFNLIFLWVFGNAVCSKLGDVLYLPVYIGAGLVAAVVHLMFDDRVTVGASGAIYGIIGIYLVLYPFNSIKSLLWFVAYIRCIKIAGLWVILSRIVLDVLGAVSGYTEGAAYFAHIGGFVGGIILALILLKTRLVTRDSMDDAIVRSMKI
jgi:membrane associated rhomboid family serine protease